MVEGLIALYPLVKTVHISCVVISGSGFLLRLFLRARASPWMQWRPMRVLPHVVDTVLLLSAVTLAVILSQYPLVHGWLTAKVLGLLLYVGAGTQALRGRTRGRRLTGASVAVLAFAYIVSVAVTHRPEGFLEAV